MINKLSIYTIITHCGAKYQRNPTENGTSALEHDCKPKHIGSLFVQIFKAKQKRFLRSKLFGWIASYSKIRLVAQNSSTHETLVSVLKWP